MTEAFTQVDPHIEVSWECDDGTAVATATVIGSVAGPLRSILTAERTALNFLCHLSGVASLLPVDSSTVLGGRTRIGTPVQTLPGLRRSRRPRVPAGGGVNHCGAALLHGAHQGQPSRRLGVTGAIKRAREVASN